MATPIGNMVVHLGLDNNGFQTKLNQTSNSLKSFKNNIKQMENQLKTSQAMSKYAITGREAFKAYGYQVKDLNRLITTHSQYQSKLVKDYQRVTAGTKGLAADVDILNKRYQEAKIVYGENSEQAIAYAKRLQTTQEAMAGSTKQAQNLANEYENSRQKLFQYRSELKEAIETQYSQYSVTARLGSGLTTIGNGLSTVSQKTRGMTVAIGTGFAVAAKSAIEFESGITTVKALLSDTVPEEQMTSTMNRLSDSVKKWGTTYGMTTSEIIEGMQEMIRRGYDANQTMAAMPHVLEASKASGEAFGTVMEVATAILEQFNLKAEDTQRVTDSLTYVANKTAADYVTLGTAMQYVGPMAATAGISLEQTASAIGLLSQRGIEGEKAGTNLRAVLSTLISPTEANAKAWEQMGVSTDAFLAGSIDLADVLDLIKVNTEGMTDAQKAALISQAVGRTGQAGLNAMVAQGGDALRNLTKETENATGSTKKMADEMMKSSENQLKQMVAQLEQMAIEIGEDLLPYIKDLIDDGKKLIEWFSNLNPKTKEAALKFALVTAAISPFAGALGLIAKAGGGTLSFIATLTGKIKSLNAMLKLGSGATEMASGLATIGGAATTAGTEVGLFGSVVGALATPLGLTVGALALVGGGLLAFGTYLGINRARAEEWGTTVSSVEANELSKFKEKVDKTSEAIDFFGTKAGSIDNVKTSFKELVDEINRLNEENLTKDIDIASKLGLSDTVINALKERSGQITNNVQSMSDEVIAIYERHNNDTSQLTEQEKAIVLNNQTEMINKALELMKISGNKKKAIQKAMNGELNELNTTQLQQAQETASKMLDDEVNTYKKKKKELNDTLSKLDESQVDARKEVLDKLDTLEADHQAKMDAYGDKYIEITEAWLKSLNLGASTEQQLREQIMSTMEEYGIDYEAALDRISAATDKNIESNKMWALSTADMSDEMKAANITWNNLTWKDGEIKTNAQEEIQKALQAENGWNNMKFVVQNANLESNAVFAVGQALIAVGQWDNLSPEDKQLIIDKAPAMGAINETAENMQAWKEIPDPIKNFLAQDDDFLNKTETTKEVLNNWNNLPVEVKQFLVENSSAITDAESAKSYLEAWNQMTPEEKVLAAKNLTAETTMSAQQTMNSLTDVTRFLKGENLTQGEKDAAQATMNSLQNVTRSLMSENLTQPQKDAAQATMNGLENVKRALKGENLTKSEKDAAQNTLDSLKGVKRDLKASNKAGKGVKDAQDTIDSLTGRTVDVYVNYIETHIVKKKAEEKTGTDFFEGGLAVVNDQVGATYKELITLPDGTSFIPQGRNVTMDLPRGTKILKAAKTKALMQRLNIPRFADGVGYSADSPLFKAMDMVQQKVVVAPTPTIDNTELVLMLREIAELLRAGNKKVPVSKVYLDSELITRKVSEEQARQSRIESIMKGVPI